MNLAKSIFAVAMAAAALLVAMPAEAQTYGTISFSAVPGTIQAGLATNQTAVIDCRANRQLTFYLQAAGTNTTTTNVTAHFIQSPDNVTYSTVSGFDLVLPLNNTTTACITTNVDCGAIGFWKLQYVTNAAAVPITNVLVGVCLKPGQ
jgi:hypothetical protein